MTRAFAPKHGRGSARLGCAALLLAALSGCGPAPIQAIAVSNTSLTSKLIAHWSFDETSGTTVADRSGNGYDGQLTGGAWKPSGGRFGGGLRLDLTNSVLIPNFPAATADWTVSVWIYLTQADRDSLGTDRAVLLTAEKPSMGGWEIEFDPRKGFDWLEASYYVASPTNDYVVLACKCIDTDRWLHFTAVFDSSTQSFSLYHGAMRADSATPPAPILPGQPDLYIGRWHEGPRPIAGVIDDYAVWTRALSPDEIAAIDARAVPDPL